MTRTITDEQIERLRKIAKMADNSLNATSSLLLPSSQHRWFLEGLRAIKNEAAALYRELGGEE